MQWIEISPGDYINLNDVSNIFVNECKEKDKKVIFKIRLITKSNQDVYDSCEIFLTYEECHAYLKIKIGII